MNRFVFITPMFNGSATLARMLHSVCGQSYENWRIIIIDDASEQKESVRCEEIVHTFEALTANDQITIIHNSTKKWEVANVLEGLKHCAHDDIVCRLDADDWLTDLDALVMIDSAYNTTNCDVLWTAHRWGFSDKNISNSLPNNANPYSYPWVTSHLKTFRKYLIDDVSDVNFRGKDGNYIRRAGDQAIYLPVLHRAKRRVFLPRVLYHYAIDDRPQTYATADAIFQRDEAEYIRARGYVGAN